MMGQGSRLGDDVLAAVAKHVDGVIAEYMDTHPYLLSPDSARDRCWFESEGFRDALMARGIDAELLSGFRFTDSAAGLPLHARVITGGHTVVRVGDVTYDWTIRQFAGHEEDEVPRISTVEQFGHEWEAI